MKKIKSFNLANTNFAMREKKLNSELVFINNLDLAKKSDLIRFLDLINFTQKFTLVTLLSSSSTLSIILFSIINIKLFIKVFTSIIYSIEVNRIAI